MRLTSSLSLRLTLTYLLTFTVSVVALGAGWWWWNIRTPMQDVERRVQREMRELRAAYLESGREALLAKLDERVRAATGRAAFHAFLEADGSLVAGNLPSWPPRRREGWLRIEADLYADGDEVDHEALALDTALGDGTRLLAGRDIEDIDELEEKLLTAVSGLLAGTLILGLVGGLVMSRAIGRRIAAVTRAAQRVMAGDLSGRVPLRGTSDDFERLNVTLNQMLARTERMFESVRRVSDNVAHELRTPLARLRASLEQMRDAPPDAAMSRLEEAVAEAAGLEKTFDAVLRIARIESGRHGGVSVPVDLSALLVDAAELYGPLAEERSQSLLTAVEPALQVTGDRDLLFQSVCNLLDNAIKYSPEAGIIRLSAGRRGQQVEVTVSDNGPGVAPEHAGRITERFYRVPGTADRPGAGLGLSLVAAVADLHDSRLTFEDAQPGLGVRWVLAAR